MALMVFTDGVDTYVAESLDDLALVYQLQTSCTLEEVGLSLDDWEEVPGDKVLTICNVHDLGADDKETRTAAEWAAVNGRGLLCSTEW